MLLIDGDREEGGGQILRTSLALAAVTAQSFRIRNIRRRRNPSGLKAQHLCGVRLVAELCGAALEGDALGSGELVFRPGSLRTGRFCADVGTAGSLTLMLQSALLPALFAPGPVELELRGGTDVTWSPPTDYLRHVLLPYYRLFGDVREEVPVRGFHPKGGGRIRVQVSGGLKPPPCDLVDSFQPESIRVRAVAAEDLRERRVAERLLEGALGELPGAQTDHEYSRARSPGCAVVIWGEGPPGAWPRLVGADQLGQRGVPAERIGVVAGRQFLSRQGHSAPVEEHLADNLIPLLGLAGGEFRAQLISPHTLANAYVVSTFLGVKIEVEEERIRCLKRHF